MTEIVAQLAAGQLGILTVVLWTFIAFLVAMVGGAIAGVRLAGKDLGTEVAALLGAMFGPSGAVPGVLVGLVILAVLQRS
jgi:hypothetical protein